MTHDSADATGGPGSRRAPAPGAAAGGRRAVRPPHRAEPLGENLLVSGCGVRSLLARHDASFSATWAALQGASPCAAHACASTCCDWVILDTLAQFVLECLHTRGAERRPAIFGGAVAVRPPFLLPAMLAGSSATETASSHMNAVHAEWYPGYIRYVVTGAGGRPRS